jgi:hypothetical protein
MEREENVSDKTVPVEISPIDYDSDDEELVAINESSVEQDQPILKTENVNVETDQIEVKPDSFITKLCKTLLNCTHR